MCIHLSHNHSLTVNQSTAAEEHFIFVYSLRTIGLTDKQSTAAEHISINCGQLALRITSQQHQEDILFFGILFSLTDIQSTTAGELYILVYSPQSQSQPYG